MDRLHHGAFPTVRPDLLESAARLNNMHDFGEFRSNVRQVAVTAKEIDLRFSLVVLRSDGRLDRRAKYSWDVS